MSQDLKVEQEKIKFKMDEGIKAVVFKKAKSKKVEFKKVGSK